MEKILERLREKHRRVSEFINENYDILNKEEVQSKSEIDLFNKIGDYAIDKNYHPVYFKSKKPSNPPCSFMYWIQNSVLPLPQIASITVILFINPPPLFCHNNILAFYYVFFNFF